MTQTSPKPEKQNSQQSSSQLNNGDGAGSITEAEKPLNYIRLQGSQQGQAQSQSNWWQKLWGRWNDLSFRNKLTIIILGSVAVPVVAVTQFSVIQSRNNLVTERVIKAIKP